MELLREVDTGNMKGQLRLGKSKKRCRQHDI